MFFFPNRALNWRGLMPGVGGKKGKGKDDKGKGKGKKGGILDVVGNRIHFNSHLH